MLMVKNYYPMMGHDWYGMHMTVLTVTWATMIFYPAIATSFVTRAYVLLVTGKDKAIHILLILVTIMQYISVYFSDI